MEKTARVHTNPDSGKAAGAVVGWPRWRRHRAGKKNLPFLKKKFDFPTPFLVLYSILPSKFTNKQRTILDLQTNKTKEILPSFFFEMRPCQTRLRSDCDLQCLSVSCACVTVLWVTVLSCNCGTVVYGFGLTDWCRGSEELVDELLWKLQLFCDFWLPKILFFLVVLQVPFIVPRLRLGFVKECRKYGFGLEWERKIMWLSFAGKMDAWIGLGRKIYALDLIGYGQNKDWFKKGWRLNKK